MNVMILTGITYIKKVSEFLNQLNQIASCNNVLVQAMNADKIAGQEHIMFAIEKALSSIEKGSNLANDPGIEIMRYASGKRQIDEAFSMGVRKGENMLALVVMGDENDVRESVTELKEIITEKPLLKCSSSKINILMAQFNITEEEIDAVGKEKIPDLVIERVALVDYLK
ncbi:Protein of unknown function DUF509 [Methanosalsum zhilinae DSM 4017]|uniref:KEOPS complex Cgi121-like subunit n=1 Tax=Methanosalsum zhilinae (strain DSM 4017 / NBRC 107636 / OCM 62 / WeN5) TaxID=679901 RepID=F7XLH8_METZD|nr:KEOPS complex subunit Cgi121 [Methanosalsum zhilinae]AEH60704.1 Protein of unknown function DUF509 [Methanosalsum zhilinae DSM 4017]